MKKALILGLALALVGGAAYANFCARDFVPAATLLVPYGVVALSPLTNQPDPNGYTTILDVINVSNTKQLIHVVLWDPLSVHIVDFDEVLSGYDVWQINFRDLLNGAFNLFDTGAATDGSGPTATSPEVGGFWVGTIGTATSTWAGAGMTGFPTQYGPSANSYFTASPPSIPIPEDVDYPTPSSSGCAFPYGPLPGIGSAIISDLQASIWPGVPQDGSGCTTGSIASPDWLTDTPTNPVWFYVTIDDVAACSQAFPDSISYWNGNSGGKYPTDNNVLIGNVYYLSPGGNFSESVPAVSIEADSQWPTYTGWHSGSHTVGFWTPEQFESTYTGNNDDHEPLATAFGFEYYNGGGITSYLRAWRKYNDAEYNPSLQVVAWDACEPYIYYAWDQNENCLHRGHTVSGFGTAEPNVIPYNTQEVPLTPVNFDGLPAAAGWVMFVFDPSIFGTITDPTDSDAVQAWMGVKYYWGTYSTELEAAVLGNFWCFSNNFLPNLNTYNGSITPMANTYVPQ